MVDSIQNQTVFYPPKDNSEQTLPDAVPNYDDCKWEQPPALYNVFASVDLGVALDLRRCAKLVDNFEYPHENTAQALLSLKSPRAAVNVHLSGKLNVIGQPSVAAAKVALRRSARKIQRAHKDVRFRHFAVTQLSASAKLPYRLDLSLLHKRYPENTFYDVELTQSLRMELGEARLTIYANGRVICQSRSADSMVDAYRIVEDEFESLAVK